MAAQASGGAWPNARARGRSKGGHDAPRYAMLTADSLPFAIDPRRGEKKPMAHARLHRDESCHGGAQAPGPAKRNIAPAAAGSGPQPPSPSQRGAGPRRAGASARTRSSEGPGRAQGVSPSQARRQMPHAPARAPAPGSCAARRHCSRGAPRASLIAAAASASAVTRSPESQRRWPEQRSQVPCQWQASSSQAFLEPRLSRLKFKFPA